MPLIDILTLIVVVVAGFAIACFGVLASCPAMSPRRIPLVAMGIMLAPILYLAIGWTLKNL